MKIKELRELGPEELTQKVKDLKKELFDLNFQRRHARVEKPGRFRTIRRDIARILTLLNNGNTESKKNPAPKSNKERK